MRNKMKNLIKSPIVLMAFMGFFVVLFSFFWKNYSVSLTNLAEIYNNASLENTSVSAADLIGIYKDQASKGNINGQVLVRRERFKNIEQKITELCKKVTNEDVISDYSILRTSIDYSSISNMTDGEKSLLGSFISANRYADAFLEKSTWSTKVLEYNGGSLLSGSRNVITKMETLGLAYYINKYVSEDENWSIEAREKARLRAESFADRAIEELMAVSNFTHWNHESSYLDTAEMATAVAMGYDWFYDCLEEDEKDIISNAIIEKALLIYIAKNSKTGADPTFITRIDNWNSVCNGGIATAAMVIMAKNSEDDKIDIKNIELNSFIKTKLEESGITSTELTPQQLASSIVSVALDNMPLVMQEMEEDGAYPEGTDYCEYAVKYIVTFMSSLENTFGQCFNLFKNKGLYKILKFPMLVVSDSTNLTFNYADVQQSSKYILGENFLWLANKYLNDDNLKLSDIEEENNKAKLEAKENAKVAYYYIKKYTAMNAVTKIPSWTVRNILFYEAKNDNVTDQSQLSLKKDEVLSGEQDVAFLRTEYRNINETTDGIYIGIKAGNNRKSHGDLDIGSFVFDALNTRWLSDYGAEDYSLTEYFATSTYRWNYYNKRAEGHSTLVINPSDVIKSYNNYQYIEADQYIHASVDFLKSESKDNSGYVTMDLSSVYNREYNNSKNSKTNSNKVKRGIKLLNNRKVAILQDEISLENEGEIYSFLNIDSSVTIKLDEANNKIAYLTKDGKKVKLKILGESDGNFEIMSKKSIHEFLNKEEFAMPDEPGEKLAIHLSKIKDATISVAFIPIYSSDFENLDFGVEAIDEWHIPEQPVISDVIDNKNVVISKEENNENDEIYYSIDGGKNWTKYLKQIEFKEAGTYKILAKTVSKSGMDSNIKEKSITIEEPEKPYFIIENYNYYEDGNVLYIDNIKANTKLDELEKNIKTNIEYQVEDTNGNEIKNTDLVGTGMTLKLDSEENKEYKIIVTGDLNGDGKINDIDLLKLARYNALLDVNLNGAYLKSADIYKDNVYADNKDLLKIARILAGLENI